MSLSAERGLLKKTGSTSCVHANIPKLETSPTDSDAFFSTLALLFCMSLHLARLCFTLLKRQLLSNRQKCFYQAAFFCFLFLPYPTALCLTPPTGELHFCYITRNVIGLWESPTSPLYEQGKAVLPAKTKINTYITQSSSFLWKQSRLLQCLRWFHKCSLPRLFSGILCMHRHTGHLLTFYSFFI